MKKLLISFLLGLTVFFSFVPYLSPAKAQTDLWSHEWYAESNPFNWYNKVYNSSLSPSSEIFGERYTAAQVQWVTYSVFSMIWNLIPGNPGLTTCIVSGDVDQCAQTVWDGMKTILPVAQTSTNQNLTSSIYETLKNNPVSGVAYSTNLLKKFSLVSTVYAQGYGFTAANSIQVLWTAVRNMSYGLMVIAAIVLAFMIMFRVKLSPQVVISVQSAIPKLVVALILITFSYAIAGFLIDIMYVVIGLISLLISSGGFSGYNAAQLFGDFTSKYSMLGLLYLYWFHFVWRALESIFTSGADFAWGMVIFIFAILTIIAILWWSLKLFIEMIKNFVMILLTIVVGPLEIMLGTVMPGMGFGKWLRRLASYLAFYPVVVLLVFLSFFFLYQGSNTGTLAKIGDAIPFHVNMGMISGNVWKPPLSYGTVHNDGGNELIWIIISFVIFSQITKAAKMVQSFMAGKPFEFESGIGAVTGAVSTVGGAAMDVTKSPGFAGLSPGKQKLANRLKWLSYIPRSRS